MARCLQPLGNPARRFLTVRGAHLVVARLREHLSPLLLRRGNDALAVAHEVEDALEVLRVAVHKVHAVRLHGHRRLSVLVAAEIGLRKCMHTYCACCHSRSTMQRQGATASSAQELGCGTAIWWAAFRSPPNCSPPNLAVNMHRRAARAGGAAARACLTLLTGTSPWNMREMRESGTCIHKCRVVASLRCPLCCHRGVSSAVEPGRRALQRGASLACSVASHHSRPKLW